LFDLLAFEANVGKLTRARIRHIHDDDILGDRAAELSVTETVCEFRKRLQLIAREPPRRIAAPTAENPDCF
jgi:hypothetical protein